MSKFSERTAACRSLTCICAIRQRHAQLTQHVATPTIAEKTKDAKKLAGYFNLYWDARAGKLWLEIDKWNTEFLYQTSLPPESAQRHRARSRAAGRNAHRAIRTHRAENFADPIESRLSRGHERSGRARGGADSFAESGVVGFHGGRGRWERRQRACAGRRHRFFLRDTHHIPEALARTKQGAFKLDDKRCAFYLARTKNFPLNTEVEATLTFAGDDPGQWVKEVTPSPDSITVREHHSFVQLPPPVTSRALTIRARAFLVFRTWITRRRSASRSSSALSRGIALQKKDPDAAISEPVAPIVYYLDRGTPEPIRSALLEGANWWQQAFEAAGYKNAFRVEMMPEGADPMDLRYNVIQWVHRATRGWSYGEGIIDPRTGEIIKGQVSLGSLRVRQDFLIAEGLLAPYEKGKPVSPKMHGDGARAFAPTRGARSRPHARPRTQLLRPAP